jgi:glutamine synthetase
MAKPMANEPGSAMHIHQSIVEVKTGRNIFSNSDGSPAEAFRHYIGGLQKYLPAAMAFLAPYVNSYRRLVRHSAAPINIRWGRDNRTVGIRVPRSPPEARRVENRVIGADANPYVATAVTLACGYLGMKERLEPTEESTGSAYEIQYELPRTMSEALNLLTNKPELAHILGDRFTTIYRLVKELEYEEFMKVISSWEREHLLLHV